MFENVKKAIFGRGKTEAPEQNVATDAGAEAHTDAAVPGEKPEGVVSDGNVLEREVPSGAVEIGAGAANGGMDLNDESTENSSAGDRAGVEGSEHEDAGAEGSSAEELEANPEAVAQTDASAAVDAPVGELEKAKAEAAENYDKYIRAVAELENYKKRALRERADVLRYAGESMARDMLEVADHLQRALSQDLEGVREDFVKGLQLILDRFHAIMDQHQVRGESSVGVVFDPAKHEALASVPTSDHPAGTVLEEFKRAYYFKDKLLRPAQVVVSKEDETKE